MCLSARTEEELKESIKKITSPLIMIQHFVDKQNEMALEGILSIVVRICRLSPK